MSATPIIPGRAYRVRHNGQTLIVLAPNPVDALLIAHPLLLKGVI